MRFMASVSIISLLALGAPALAQVTSAPETSEPAQEEEARRVRRDKGCDKSGGRGDEAVDQHGEVKVTSFQDRTYDGSDLSPAELGQNFGWGHLPLPWRPR